MESLTLKILAGYLMVGFLSSIPLAYKNKFISDPGAGKPANLPVLAGRALFFFWVMMLLWPVIGLVLLIDKLSYLIWNVKRVSRSICDHYRYSRTSNAAKVRRLLKVYRVFRRYRPVAREEKLLRATAGTYLEVMRWGSVQIQSALSIIEPRIGTEIVSVKDLAKAVLVLKKPWFGCLSDSGYDDEFRADGEKDKTIELVLSEAYGKVVRIYGNGKGGLRPKVKKDASYKRISMQ